jgi:putative oxidoreductase
MCGSRADACSFLQEECLSQNALAGLEPYARSILRIIVGFTFMVHGSPKILGVLGGLGGKGATAPAFTLFWFAGVIEVFGGALLLLGLFTPAVALLASGEMAVAYFKAHFPNGFWPVRNGGELAVVYCFVFLYLFVAGAGPLSLDRVFRK